MLLNYEKKDKKIIFGFKWDRWFFEIFEWFYKVIIWMENVSCENNYVFMKII